MKTLALEQMEVVQGGRIEWRWTTNCKWGMTDAVVGLGLGAVFGGVGGLIGALYAAGRAGITVMTDCLWVV